LRSTGGAHGGEQLTLGPRKLTNDNSRPTLWALRARLVNLEPQQSAADRRTVVCSTRTETQAPYHKLDYALIEVKPGCCADNRFGHVEGYNKHNVFRKEDGDKIRMSERVTGYNETIWKLAIHFIPQHLDMLYRTIQSGLRLVVN
jgi:hypothetical protein